MAFVDGRSSISFAERMLANMKIKAAFKNVAPPLSPADLAARASSAEEKIFQRATSIDEYKELCTQLCSDLVPKTNARDVSSSTTSCSSLPLNSNPVEVIGNFKAQHHSSGLFSTLYRSRDPHTGLPIALKVTTPSRMAAPHDSQREARLLKALSGSPSVIPLLSTSWISGGHYIICCPFLPCDLGQLLDQHILTVKQQKHHLYALFQALNHIHSLGIMHRDIKPSNLLSRGPDGPTYLADFGIAWLEGDPSSEPRLNKITDVGTTCYRAPELLFGYQAYTEKLDMWAAGCVVAECLRDGKSLFDAGDLGSELALLKSMFTKLGTPSNETWLEAQDMPDWGKVQFTEYPGERWSDILPGVGLDAIELVKHMVTFESTKRLTAAQALKEPFFKNINTVG